MRPITVKPVKVVAHAYLTTCINNPGVFLPYIWAGGCHQDTECDPIIGRITRRLLAVLRVKEALEGSTSKAI
jgi:hypothetical protein